MQEEIFLKKEVSGMCPTHGEFVGFEINLPNFGYTRKAKCPTCVQLVSANQAKGLAAEKNLALKLGVINAGIPERFRESDFQSFKPKSDGDAKRLNALIDYALNFKAKTAKNIFLLGDVDLGKTHLCCALAKELILQGRSVIYSSTTTLLAAQKDVMFNDGQGTSSEFMTKHTTCKLLILDEFGLSKFTDYEKTFINSVLNTRYDNMLPTMIVGNVKRQTIVEMIGDRASSRLESSLISITVDGGVSHG